MQSPESKNKKSQDLVTTIRAAITHHALIARGDKVIVSVRNVVIPMRREIR